MIHVGRTIEWNEQNMHNKFRNQNKCGKAIDNFHTGQGGGQGRKGLGNSIVWQRSAGWGGSGYDFGESHVGAWKRLGRGQRSIFQERCVALDGM